VNKVFPIARPALEVMEALGLGPISDGEMAEIERQERVLDLFAKNRVSNFGFGTCAGHERLYLAWAPARTRFNVEDLVNVARAFSMRARRDFDVLVRDGATADGYTPRPVSLELLAAALRLPEINVVGVSDGVISLIGPQRTMINIELLGDSAEQISFGVACADHALGRRVSDQLVAHLKGKR
jgi:hypothetical protein